MTDLVKHQPHTALSERMEFARALSTASLLPRAYQQNPGNVLLAMELGDALGIRPIQAINAVHVIEGRPSASADLIASLVRKAGHKLRISGDDTTATAQIIRADDPEFVYETTWTLDRAKAAGLTGKGVWKSYPAAMLKARAITEVARMGASDALYGVVYTPEELGAETDGAGEPVPHVTAKPVGTAALRAAVAPEQSAPVEDITDAEEVHDEPTDPMQGGEDFPAEQNRLNAMFAEFGRAGFTTDARSAEGRKARLDYCSNILGRPVESSKDMSAGQVERVINALKVDGAEDQQ
jgi:hypothetical protein